ncbi:chromosome segregation protein SMC [Heliobacterium chlorum]|uniref:Chromosome partition protein Smc n=1 Tax=Heliobacterium chlorum TaxID=2698 RepID=A0ABR7T1D9_HELCL|nr:chromosome segregation protein SMC [Heliobacterium chlorum]MBC9783366.1 chromosome segregation protein SMC [Heliobacterium chlorum]
MALKRIEINGFKSFADKTDIVLSPGLTVVVGPNGSGKSNVADAIRWVLGEQSPRSLRGAKMEDVIFAGSDRRKPVGMAEVSITLNNEKGLLPVDFREVTVTRRVFRSGDSDYLLNRSPCRLKDLQELFADTGLGREGISIIGQGKVDEVLSSRPEERRAIIEEAAGIVRYRNRKREAAKKLEETQQHITRLDDIIGELEQQLDSIREQAEKARRYKKIDSELKQLELGLLVLDFAEITEKTSTTRLELEKLSRSLWEKEAQLATVEGVEAAAALKARQAEEALTAARQKAHLHSEQVLSLQGQINVVRERLKGLQNQLQIVTKEMSLSTSALEDMGRRQKEQTLRREHVLAELESVRREVEERLSKGKASREEVTASEAEIQQMRQQMFSLAQELTTLRAQLHEVEINHTRIETQSHRLDDEVSRTDSRTRELMEGIANCRTKTDDAQSLWERVRQELTSSEQEKSQLQGQHTELEHGLTQTMRRWQEVSARRKALDSMDKNHEGFALGVREILSQLKAGNGQMKGIHGVFSDLIQVPSGLEVALEVALGGAMQNIVVEDDDAARRGVEHLKACRKGRATFLPLRSLQVYGGPGRDVLNMAGVIGCAADLVQCDAAYMPAVRFLLGRTLVMEDLPGALRLAKQTRYHWRIVTLEGEILQPGGSVTGGSLNQKGGGQTFLRRREMAMLEEEEKSLGTAISSFKQQREELAEQISRLSMQIQELNRRILTVEAEKNSLEMEAVRLQRAVEQDQGLVEKHRQEQKLLQEELVKMAGQKELLQEKLSAAEAENQELESTVNQKLEALSQLRIVGETDREELNRWQMTGARLEEELKGLEQAILSIEEETSRIEREAKEKEERSQSTSEEIADCEKEITELERNLACRMVEEAEVQQEVSLCRQLQEETASELQNKLEERKHLTGEITPLREKVHQLEVQLARLEAEANTITQRLAEQWELTPEQATEKGIAPQDRRASQKEMNQYKNLLREMGAVNLLAIEEEQRLEERLSFLQHQFEDLQTAKGTLEQVIQEMEEIMIRRFGQAFAEINSKFRQVFTDLFRGGSAELVLSDPNDLLTTGVDILAQPPGKKLVNLSLLSGGERALTAIALLFSLLQVRPSPFCVLDEIEAALDEANVARFARYLRSLTEQSQFIVISHRKGTMESADFLYGVTMEEAGVSKLISVRMTESAAM